jgi:hypothetical protein
MTEKISVHDHLFMPQIIIIGLLGIPQGIQDLVSFLKAPQLHLSAC